MSFPQIPKPEQLSALLSNMDIYLLDMIMKGHIKSGMSILDAGCGTGRNLLYFIQADLDAYGIDVSEKAIETLHTLVAQRKSEYDLGRIINGDVAFIPFPDANFDLIISSAVLHFAKNDTHFLQMVNEMWRVLKPGGLFFARLASSIGIEHLVIPMSDNRYLLPDGTERYLVTEKQLLKTTTALNGLLVEPLKTVNVQSQRCMTTWCIQKS